MELCYVAGLFVCQEGGSAADGAQSVYMPAMGRLVGQMPRVSYTAFVGAARSADRAENIMVDQHDEPRACLDGAVDVDQFRAGADETSIWQLMRIGFDQLIRRAIAAGRRAATLHRRGFSRIVDVRLKARPRQAMSSPG